MDFGTLQIPEKERRKNNDYTTGRILRSTQNTGKNCAAIKLSGKDMFIWQESDVLERQEVSLADMG